MSNIFVEQKEDRKWKATQNHQVIATGNTQAKTAEKAHRVEPDDPVFGERVRFTKGGKPDRWRRMY